MKPLSTSKNPPIPPPNLAVAPSLSLLSTASFMRPSAAPGVMPRLPTGRAAAAYQVWYARHNCSDILVVGG